MKLADLRNGIIISEQDFGNLSNEIIAEVLSTFEISINQQTINEYAIEKTLSRIVSQEKVSEVLGGGYKIVKLVFREEGKEIELLVKLNQT